MNQNKRVMRFALLAVALMLLLSASSGLGHFGFLSLQNVSIVSDIFIPKTSGPPQDAETSAPLAAAPATDLFGQYRYVHTLINFSPDSGQPSLPVLMQRLAQLKADRHHKVRIAWLGDSMIEGDLLTQTFRRRMQQEFGGRGAGFIAVQSGAARFRTTVKHEWSEGWREETFKSPKHTAPLYLSGHVFFSEEGTMELTDKAGGDTTLPLVKSLICGYSEAPVSAMVNGTNVSINPAQPFNRIVLDSSSASGISVQLPRSALPVYGVSLEPEGGVVVDNFSFRGVSGVELGGLDTDLLQRLPQQNPYDLVVLQYGANLMFRPDDSDYSWFFRKMQPVLARMRRAMPGTEFLIISTADRAFRYDGTWKTAVGIDSLLRGQAQLAYDNKTAFYNLYRSMGGKGTIVQWADSNVTLANKDYIHPNQRGAEVLGNMIFDAFMNDYHKAVKTAPPRRPS